MIKLSKEKIMANYQNLLVALNPDKDEQEALRRAVYIVKKNGGQIKIFLAIYDFSHDVTTILSQEERAAMRQSAIDKQVEWIKHIAHHYITAGIPIEIKVVWHNQPYKALIEEVVSFHHDLLLKETHLEEGIGRILFTPIDWQLLRKCPCPVWLVKDRPWPEKATALVAVNLSSDEEQYDELNQKLVTESLELAQRLENRTVHLVAAYPDAAMSIAVELPEFDPNKFENSIRGQYLIAMKSFRQKYAISEELTHVEQGSPETIIPKIAHDINAGIVVIGTVGRTGLSAAFIGNTTERVIDSLDCDLLAIKPDGFESQLALDNNENENNEDENN